MSVTSTPVFWQSGRMEHLMETKQAEIGERNDDSLLLTEAEARSLLRLSRKTLGELRRRGRLRYIKFCPRCLRYRRADIEQLIAASLQTGNARARRRTAGVSE